MKANEDNFISLIKKRREEGIRYVMEEYGGLLQSIVKKRLYGMPDKVEECMNDIFFGIWNNIGSFDPKRSSFKSWAAGVARFQAIDYLRRYGKQLQQESWEEVELSAEDENLNRLVAVSYTHSEPTRRTPISYAVFCLKKKKKRSNIHWCEIYIVTEK